MRRETLTLAIGCCFVLLGSVAYGQGVYVNGTPVSIQQIQMLQQQLGVPTSAAIPSGRYWYDKASGLWGMEGGPTLGQIFPWLDLGGPLQSNASNGKTGVFINGREIHHRELAYLQRLFGYVNLGRYWLDARGIGGYEGGPAQFDIRAAARAVGAASGSYGGYTRRTPFGGIGGDSNCSYYLHPGGPSVLNCD